MTASPFDCVVRGFASLRANWRLVPLLWLQQAVAMALVLLGAAVPLAVLGRSWWSAFAGWRPADAAEMLLDLAAAVAPVALPLAIALLGTAVVWTLAVVAFCWFQAGSMAVLVAAERQAPPGSPSDWRVFAVYDRALFAAGARRLWRRYFGFWNLWGLAACGWLAAFAVVVLAAQRAAAEWGWPGLVVVGMGGALALAAGFLLLAGWGLVAPPALAEEGATVGGASRRALALLVRRPLAVGIVVGVFLGAALVVWIAMNGLTAPLLLIDVESHLAGWIAGYLVLALIQVAAQIGVSTAMSGALAALVVGDGREAGARGGVAASRQPSRRPAPPAAAPPASRRWSEVPR